jgi:transposase
MTRAMFTREADELILTMLEMHERGVRQSEIARRLDVGKGKVIGALRRVREEDLDAHTGQPSPPADQAAKT